jgi:hypothetical protein
MMQVVHECEESRNAGMVQNCHRNPDGTDIYDDSSNMMEVSPVDKEESDVGALSVPS